MTDTEHGVVFDGNQWAWTEPGSPNSFLVRDIDKNGSIDSLRELFSNISPQSPSFAPNGFRALADLDSNSDGGVDSRDRLYSELQWWTDLNHDGISQSTELDKVTESLSTTYKLSRRVDEYMNQFRYRAKVGNGWIYDVFLTVRP